MRTFDTQLDRATTKMFANADYFEALNFSFTHESAVRVYKYAHGGKGDSIADSRDWELTLKKLGEVVPLAKDRKRLTVKVFNYNDPGVGDGLSGGAYSGFVFILDRKLVGWTTWMQYIS